MINKILQTIVTALGELLELIVKLFLGSIELSLPQIATSFPFLAVGYRIFQGIAIGFVAIIAVWSAVKRAASGLTGWQSKGDIANHVLRIILAVGLIYFGNKILVELLELTKIPFDYFAANLDGIINLKDVDWRSMHWTSTDTTLAAAIAAIGTTTMLLATIVLILLIGYNLIKLLLEIFERYLLIGLLIYASPLAFMTLAGEDSDQFCIKYIKSFIGQCAVMVISIWSVQIVLSGFAFTTADDNVFFRLIATYAVCKIAQKLDTYMQGWGVGTLTTGQNLLDAGVAAFAALRAGKNRGSSNEAPVSNVGGVLGGLSSAIKGAKNSYIQGGTSKDIRTAAKTGFMKGSGLGGVMRNREKKAAGEKLTFSDHAKALGLAVGSGPVTNRAEALMDARNKTFTDKAALEEKEAARQAEKAQEKQDRQAEWEERNAIQQQQRQADLKEKTYSNKPSTKNWTDEQKKDFERSRKALGAYTYDNLKSGGPGGISNGSFNEQAIKNGLDISSEVVNGPEMAVGSFGAKNCAELGQPENAELNQKFINSIAQSPEAAGHFMSYGGDMSGNDELTDAVIKSRFDLPPEFSDPDGAFSNTKRTEIPGGGYKVNMTYNSENRNKHLDVEFYSSTALNNPNGLPKNKQISSANDEYVLKNASTRGKNKHSEGLFRYKK